MSHRRNPLSSLPNAANSPYRAVTAGATKRSRADAGLQEDPIDTKPPVKRQTLGSKNSNFCTPPRQPTLQAGDDGLFGKKAPNRKPTTFDRKLLAARQPQKTEKQGRPSREPTRDIEAWQRHYRKVFPLFVFYFENISEDARMGCSRGIRSLGAREEKFFSKDVTHIITTRAVPSKSDSSPTELESSSSKSTSSQSNSHPRTINPSLLDRQMESSSHGEQLSSNKFPLEASLGKKGTTCSRNVIDGEQKKAGPGNVDILQKAHGMGIKIWQLEKLQRILNTMSDGARESQTQHSRTTRGVTQLAGGKGAREVDLSHMLRNEQQYGPSDRDHGVFADELVTFRGYYIYVRDMDEKTKPVMIKEYSKPSRGEAGEWPQFHANNPGKCPFVEDHSVTRQELENACQRLKEERVKGKAEARAAPRTRAETANEKAKVDNQTVGSERKPLAESKSAANKMCTAAEDLPARGPCAPPALAQAASENKLRMMKAISAPNAPNAPRLFGGEPAASGLQPSNVTSAIRSQIISSTAAAPGAKAGTSREVHGLKRKVLEKNSAPALHGIQARSKPPPAAVPARAEHAIPLTRQSRKKAQEKLVNIEEESTQSEDEEEKCTAEDVQLGRARAKVISIKHKEPKPGYCENCREKYEDFEEHIVGRKHRRFALSKDPWVDLDKLLSQLGRPLKEEPSIEEPPEEPSDP